MSLIAWSNAYSVGVPSIDEQHKGIVQMLNDLHDGMLAKKSRETLGDILERLLLYTAEHFEYEELLFAQTNYAGAELHAKEHEALRQRVTNIYARYKANNDGTLTLEVLNFLRDWLNQHINGSDKKYASHFQSNNIG